MSIPTPFLYYFIIGGLLTILMLSGVGIARKRANWIELLVAAIILVFFWPFILGWSLHRYSLYRSLHSLGKTGQNDFMTHEEFERERREKERTDA